MFNQVVKILIVFSYFAAVDASAELRQQKSPAKLAKRVRPKSLKAQFRTQEKPQVKNQAKPQAQDVPVQTKTENQTPPKPISKEATLITAMNPMQRGRSNTVEIMFTSAYQKPLDTIEGQDPMALYSLNANYNFTSTKAVGFRSKYFYSLVQYADDDSYQGAMNSDIYFSDRSLWTNQNKDMNISYTVGITLPTSESSQFAGMRAGVFGTLTLFKRFVYVDFMFSNTLGFNNYKWDTADPAGTVYNEKSYLINSLMLRRSFGLRQQTSIGLGTTFYTGNNIYNTYSQNYNIFTDVGYQFNRNIMLNLQFGSQDRRSENTNLFLNEKMFIALSIGLSV